MGKLVVGDVRNRAEHSLGFPRRVEKRLPGGSKPALAVGQFEGRRAQLAVAFDYHAIFDVVAASALGIETAPE